ncbi:hypothetical protein I4I73_03280 [Pseudonocardia sp. KRD-184]|uniref:Uncharacterized protein n=1 Tax=Pseudonocardia oceani TaxID=2792013 RepID=A0ABS6UGY5_9PSEU|nr:hypothetical protein [Pseudonocardia oceani]MBW0088237.1 hypothetical protein [Pseudonocardia oceani]MBW0095019.1 hypothetical protein [Pseudonocardia oceani]MBW0121128.1 hypothetical protein [Pseudonocardia oceani]MBW0131186.1 hypothetical protein [Pseudonocardia oceani]MBW0132552.1 hypothetical protein [Pseudonocardia oceani]
MAKLDLYEVPHRGHTATLKLSEDEAEALYGDRAKRVGPAAQVEPQPVPRPPYATDDSDDAEPVPAEKQAPAPRNKARTASTSQK